MSGVYQAMTAFWNRNDVAMRNGIPAGSTIAASKVIAKVAAIPKVVETANDETDAMTMAIATPA